MSLGIVESESRKEASYREVFLFGVRLFLTAVFAVFHCHLSKTGLGSKPKIAAGEKEKLFEREEPSLEVIIRILQYGGAVAV